MANNERLLAAVPTATYAAPQIGAGQKWSASYNVACWLRGRSAEAEGLSLVLRYRDGDGERQVLVDRARVGKDAGVLLSGCVSVAATGRIAEMTVWLVSAEGCEVFVDELYVQRAGQQVAVAPMLAAVR